MSNSCLVLFLFESKSADMSPRLQNLHAPRDVFYIASKRTCLILHERVFNITIMNGIIVVGVEISSRDGSLFISLSVILRLDLVMKALCRNISATLLLLGLKVKADVGGSNWINSLDLGDLCPLYQSER